MKNTYGLTTLFAPQSVTADIVFVHGLGGGSVSTWSYTKKGGTYWPHDWLKHEPGFETARIHSFGYNARFLNAHQNRANVDMFAQQLLEQLKDNQDLSTHPWPFILVGHSMGGLVIKKAVIISKENLLYKDLASRIHSIIFLATPHRGSDYAPTIDRMLISTGVRKDFVNDLRPDSEILKRLNEDFARHYTGIQLHSFIETIPEGRMIMSFLIVDKESATLGYPEERVQALQATHRSIAKFDSPKNPNYLAIKNRLASIIKSINSGSIALVKTKKIWQYLKVDDSAEKILSSIKERRLEDSCKWLTQREKFRAWQLPKNERYFWLKGNPGTGKTVISSYLVDHLHRDHCSYHFFKHGEGQTSSLSAFLRSIALQMSRVNDDIREALFELAQQDASYHEEDGRDLWRVLYTGGVFKSTLERQHYWIIDAPEEIADSTEFLTLFKLLATIDNNIPLKVFITSRHLPGVEGPFAQLPVLQDQVTVPDTNQDIESFVRRRSRTLDITPERQEKLVKQIMDRSSGNFLWTTLVMKQLRAVNIGSDIDKILEKLPAELEKLYLSNVEKMREMGSPEPAKTILTWVLYSKRTMTLPQLKNGIEISLSEPFTRNLRRVIDDVCGQFVDVDKDERVRIVHGTVRDFLSHHSRDSEFCMNHSDGHTKLAQACLQALFELKAPRQHSGIGINSTPSFVEYACEYLFEHVMEAISSSDDLYPDLTEFFDSTVLYWIERVAKMRKLKILVNTSARLEGYFILRRAKHVSLDYDPLSRWVVDLLRITTQFGRNLLHCPSAIHNLIPPLCPRNSAIFTKFAHKDRRVILRGLSDSTWSDQIACTTYHEKQAIALAHKNEKFAIGFASGTTTLFDTTTCQQILDLGRVKAVRALTFGSSTRYIASSDSNAIRLWDTDIGRQLFEIDQRECLALAFNKEGSSLISFSSSRDLVYWSTERGTEDRRLRLIDTASSMHRTYNIGKTPEAAEISIEQGIVALRYRDIPVQLWSLEGRRPMGVCAHPASGRDGVEPNTLAAVLNRSSSCPWLVVSYWNSTVCLFDVRTQRALEKAEAYLETMAASPNGKFLAGADRSGSVQVRDFRTLQLLYRTPCYPDQTVTLAFTDDDLRIIDVRDRQTNVWAPRVLAGHDNMSATSSDQPQLPCLESAVKMSPHVLEPIAQITAMYCCDKTKRAFAGTSDGRVLIYDLENPAEPLHELYNHQNRSVSITHVIWSPLSKIVVTADNSNRFQAKRLTCPNPGSTRWEVENVLDEQLYGAVPVSQILLSSSGHMMLISSLCRDLVWDFRRKKVLEIYRTDRKSVKWLQYDAPGFELMLYEDGELKSWKWQSSGRASRETMQDVKVAGRLTDLTSMVIGSNKKNIVFKEAHNVKNRHHTSDREAALFSIDLTAAARKPTQLAKFQDLYSVLGIIEPDNYPALVYITTTGGVRSIELRSSDAHQNPQQRCLIPPAWLSRGNAFIATIMENKDIVLARDGKVVVIENGFVNFEDVVLPALDPRRVWVPPV